MYIKTFRFYDNITFIIIIKCSQVYVSILYGECVIFKRKGMLSSSGQTFAAWFTQL